ncbi:ATP-dependent DNA ligase, partial [Patescibacteria group bacterium]
IALLEGAGSQDGKVLQLANLLQQVDQLSAKFIVRIVLGTTRLGFTELTVIDALSDFLVGNKSLKRGIESRYFVHPDIGLITKILKKEGIDGLEKISMEAGVPILSQKAQRIGSIKETIDKLEHAWAEFKFDGTRVQLHMDKKKKFSMEIQQEDLFGDIKSKDYLVRTFTRNLEDSTHQHPEIVSAVMSQVKADSIILDGEAIGIDNKTGEFLPFQQIMQRKRKHGVKSMSEEIPLQYFVFDILYLNGKPLIDKPLEERYEILNSVIEQNETIKITEHVLTKKESELQKYYDKAKKLNLEGLVVKKPDDPYQAGARSYSWVKLKSADEKLLDDSVDLVVLGYYRGRGERSKFGIGGFLAGLYNAKEEKYLTITKVGTGLTDDQFRQMKTLADKYVVKEVPKNVDIPKNYIPDTIIAPEIVVEIGADEVSISKTHSAGYALRFPRLIKFRTDKKPTQSTNIEEIKKLHSLQKRGNYNK